MGLASQGRAGNGAHDGHGGRGTDDQRVGRQVGADLETRQAMAQATNSTAVTMSVR